MTNNKKSSLVIPASVFTSPGHTICFATCLVVCLSAVPSAFADATVYRCGPKGSQWYSQIPCAEDSEAVIIKEQHMLGDAYQVPDAGETPGDQTPDDASAAGESNSANNAEAFITQLEKQRSEQLSEIDRDIARLQTQVASDEEGEENPVADEENTALLASLQNTRESIVSEYEAMIQAARQRIDNP